MNNYKLNHEISQRIVEKANSDTAENWYQKGVEDNKKEFLNWLMENV